MDHDLYLSRIAEFVRLLSREGLSVGTKEAEDACRALELTGFAERESVKAALRTICAKSQAECSAFDRLFDAFFVSSEQKLANLKKAMEDQQELEKRRAEAAEELKKHSFLKADDDFIGGYAALPEEEKDRLRRFLNKFRDNAERNPQLYEGFIRSVFMKSIMEQQLMMEDADLGVQETDPDLGLLFRDISQISDAEMPRAVAMIQRISRQINGELSARKNKSSSAGALDIKRTIRKGLETGGSLIRLKYKRKRPKHRRLVLLCDVSGSMIQFSEFALRFIKSMSDVSESSRVFLFSEETAEVDPFALQDMDQFVSYVRRTGLYGKGTDLGSALDRICAVKPPVLDQKTTLLIISDAKTVRLEDAQKSVIRAASLAGEIIWMNPIPQRKWEHLRSIRTMSVLCKMVPCSTLSELARECRKLALG
ncbi:MAG: VWA domain-containing protein [Firmicutes bacterium]|nr:VWA domain-containing protein [Bacillota bacterium]